MPDRPQPDIATVVRLLKELEQANQPGQMPLAQFRSLADSFCPGHGQDLLVHISASGLIVLDGDGPYQWVRITDRGREWSGNPKARRLRRFRNDRKPVTARPGTNVWLAIGAGFIAAAAAFVGVAGGAVHASDSHSLWKSTPMIVGYILLGLGAACFACVLGISFGFPGKFGRRAGDG